MDKGLVQNPPICCNCLTTRACLGLVIIMDTATPQRQDWKHLSANANHNLLVIIFSNAIMIVSHNDISTSLPVKDARKCHVRKVLCKNNWIDIYFITFFHEIWSHLTIRIKWDSENTAFKAACLGPFYFIFCGSPCV